MKDTPNKENLISVLKESISTNEPSFFNIQPSKREDNLNKKMAGPNVSSFTQRFHCTWQNKLHSQTNLTHKRTSLTNEPHSQMNLTHK